jgi:hypothetical protein
MDEAKGDEDQETVSYEMSFEHQTLSTTARLASSGASLFNQGPASAASTTEKSSSAWCRAVATSLRSMALKSPPAHPDPSTLALVVTTDDGTVLRCAPRQVGGILAPRHWRWKLVEECGREHIGPRYIKCAARADVARQLTDWWDARRELERGDLSILITSVGPPLPHATSSEATRVLSTKD